jgi:hypothetical protein
MPNIKLTEKPVSTEPNQESYFVVTQKEQLGGDVVESVRRVKATDISELMHAMGGGETGADAFTLSISLSQDIVIFYESTPGVWTTDTSEISVNVNYGRADITDQATIVIADRRNTFGYWDDDTKVYSVTGLTADTGSVIFQVDYAGLSIQKTLTVARLKAKEPKRNLLVVIDSSAGTIFTKRGTSTVLTAHVYYGSEEVTDQVSAFHWYRNNANGQRDPNWHREGGNVIQLTPDDVLNKAVFYCVVSFDTDQEGNT